MSDVSDIDRIDRYLVDVLGLGPIQKTKFKRFLSDSGFLSKQTMSELAHRLSVVGWDASLTWGIILVNLAANNPQIRWYVDNMPIGASFSKADMVSMLEALDLKKDSISSVVNSFERIVNLPLGTRLGWGFYSEEGRGNATLGRRPCRLSQDDRLAILYALYVFAEKCGGIKQFTLSRLMDETVQSEGVSPAKLFGLDRETMTKFLNGLGEMYGEFLSVTFTHDLEKISLREDKTSADVLALIS